MSTIKQWRKRNHITQTQLAKAIGVTQATVSAWEQEKYPPDGKQCLALQEISGGELSVYKLNPGLKPNIDFSAIEQAGAD